MILDGIIYVAYGIVYLLTAPLRAFSDVNINSSLLTGFNQASDSLGLMHSIIPYTTDAILTAIGLIVIFEVVYFAYKGFMWIIRKIPGIN